MIHLPSSVFPTHVGVYLNIPGWKVKKEDVDQFEAFMSTSEFETVLERNFTTKDFINKIRKYGSGYSGMNDDEVYALARKRAIKQMTEGIKFLRNKIT